MEKVQMYMEEACDQYFKEIKHKAIKVPELNPMVQTLYIVAFDRSKEPRIGIHYIVICLLYTSPSPRDATLSRMPSSA